MLNKISKSLIIGFTFISLFASASSSKEVFYKGNYYKLSIPEGFCDMTDTSTGKFLKSFLNDTLAKTGESLSAKIIYSKCGKKIDPKNLHPWGYVGISENDNTSQKELNEFAKKNMNADFMKEIEGLVNKAGNKTLEDYKLSSLVGEIEVSMGKPEILWTDDNSLIVYTRMSDGITLQDGVYSTTMLPKLTIFTYLYDAVKNNPDVMGMASKLDNVARTNVKSN